MPSFRRSTNRSRKGHPPTAQDGSTISASGGQEGGQGQVKIERHFQYSHDLFIGSKSSFSQREKPSLLWVRLFRKTRMGRGFPRPQQQRQAGPLPARPPFVRRNGVPHESGDCGGSDPPFCPLSCGTGQGNDIHADIHPFPMPLGVAPSTVIPAGRLKTWTQVVLLNLALSAAGLRA